MIDRLIEVSLRNRFLVVALWIGIAAWGLWAMLHAPIDAIPDLSDNNFDSKEHDFFSCRRVVKTL